MSSTVRVRALYGFIWASLGWGLLNWIPIRPLDGGAILTSFLEIVIPKRAFAVAKVISAIAGAAAAFVLWRMGLTFGAVFIVLITLTGLRSEPAERSHPRPATPPGGTTPVDGGAAPPSPGDIRAGRPVEGGDGPEAAAAVPDLSGPNPGPRVGLPGTMPRPVEPGDSPSVPESDGPQFLGIGAQKAGTTGLHENFSHHPLVWMPPEKELHYFDEKLNRPRSIEEAVHSDEVWAVRWRRQVQRQLRKHARDPASTDLVWCARYFVSQPDDGWYRSLFEPGPGHVSGEFTPDYALLGRRRIARVHELNPDLRIIYMLRNPIERAWSAVHMTGRVGEAEVSDQWYLGALEQPRVAAHTAYAANLDRWLSVFPAEQVFLGYLEDLSFHPRKLLKAVYTFLGVEDAEYRVLEPEDPLRGGVDHAHLDRGAAGGAVPRRPRLARRPVRGPCLHLAGDRRAAARRPSRPARDRLPVLGRRPGGSGRRLPDGGRGPARPLQRAARLRSGQRPRLFRNSWKPGAVYSYSPRRNRYMTPAAAMRPIRTLMLPVVLGLAAMTSDTMIGG